MSACGVFTICPFRGIVCNICCSSFDVEDTRSVKNEVARHVKRVTHHSKILQLSETEQHLHYVCIEVALTTKITRMAKMHSVMLKKENVTPSEVALSLFEDTILSATDIKCAICKALIPASDGLYCKLCVTNDGVYEDKFYYRLAMKGNRKIILGKSFDPLEDENNYSVLYKKIFTNLRSGGPDDSSQSTMRMLDFGAETFTSNYMTSDTQDVTLASTERDYTGLRLTEDKVMWTIDDQELEKNVSLMSDSVLDQGILVQKRQLYAYEKGSFHQAGLSCSTLMEYSTSLGFDTIAMSHFDGSWNETVKYLSSLISPKTGELEHVVELCANCLFDHMHLNLSEVRPELKAKICVVSQYNRRSELRQIKTLVDDKFRSKEGTDDSIENAGEADEEGMMNDILYKILKLQDTDNAETFRKTLGTLQPSTVIRYRATAVKYCLFLVRVLQRENNKMFNPSMFKLPASAEDKASAVQNGASYIQGLVFTSMQLTKAPSYSDSVLVGTSSLPSLFARASTLSVTGSFEENRPYVRVLAPYQCHSTISQLMYFLRMSFCKAMHHAATTNNKDLQRLIPDVRVFCDSKMIHELVSTATIAKKYEKKIKTGVEAAECARSGGIGTEIDTFLVRNRITSMQTKITKLEMQNCVRSSFEKIDQQLLFMLEPLKGKKLVCTKIEDESEYTVVLSDENWSDFHAALFYRRVRITEPRSSFDVLDGLMSDGDYSSRCIEGSAGSSCRPYARMISCNYYMTVNERIIDENGREKHNQIEVSIPSRNIGEILCTVLTDSRSMPGNSSSVEKCKEWSQYRRKFCQFHRDSLENIVQIMSMSLRGQPRLTEILKWRVGETNLAGTSLNEAQVLVRNSPNGTFPCVLAAFFASLKSGGGDSCQSPLLFMAPELGRRLSMVMSVMRYSLVLYIKRTQMDSVVDNGARDIKDRKMSAFALSHCVASCATRFLYDINIGCNPLIAKEVGDMEARYQIRREQGLNLITGSLTSGQFRKVMARLALVNDEKIQSRVSREAIEGFNHSKQTHLKEYTPVIQVPGGCESFVEIDHGRRLDVAMQEFVGISGWNFSGNSNDAFEQVDEATSLPGLEGYRVLRHFGTKLAHAFVQLAGNLNWGPRESQKTILTEILSGTRDSILVYGCGQGKTLAIWAACGYVFIRRLAKMTLTERRKVLEDRMVRTNTNWNALRCRTQITYMLENRKEVQDLYEMVLRDKNPIPANVIVVVACPFKALQSALMDDLKSVMCCHNSVKKMCAETEEDFIEDVRLRATRGPHGMEAISVWVATSAFLVGDTGTALIKNAVTSGVLFNLIQDEAHVVVTEGNWARQNVEIRNLPLWYVPRVGLTGTLQKQLGTSLGRMMFSRIGSIDGFAVARSENQVSVCPDNWELNATTRKEFLERKGMCRAESTIATNIMYTVVEVKGVNQSFDENLARAVLNSVVECRNKKIGPVKFERVLLLCATRKEAETIMTLATQCPTLGPRECALLMGGMEEGAISTFHQKWTKGDSYLGISTSCGSVGLNNAKCNVTIWMPNMYGIQTLYQGASRAGRAEQQSLSIYIKSKTRIDQSRRRPVKQDLNYLGIMGAQTSLPEVIRALSVNSMIPYINTAANQECRRKVLEEEMDGSIFLGERKPIKFCCDVCHSVEGMAFGNILKKHYHYTGDPDDPTSENTARASTFPLNPTSPSTPQEGVARLPGSSHFQNTDQCTTPQRTGVPKPATFGSNTTSPSPHHNNVARVAGSTLYLADCMSPERGSATKELSVSRPSITKALSPWHKSSFQLASTMLEADVEQSNRQNDEKKQSISSIKHWLEKYRENAEHCWWHYCAEDCEQHSPNCSQVFNQNTCQTAFQTFVGFGLGGRLCYRCGGCCPSGCTLPSKPKKCVDVCTRCYVCHAIETHGASQCPGDRLFGLVLWAIRSQDGHRRVKAAYDTQYPAEDTACMFPMRAPFQRGAVTDNLRLAWNGALSWISANQDNNIKFWSACTTALDNAIIDS